MSGQGSDLFGPCPLQIWPVCDETHGLRLSSTLNRSKAERTGFLSLSSEHRCRAPPDTGLSSAQRSPRGAGCGRYSNVRDAAASVDVFCLASYFRLGCPGASGLQIPAAVHSPVHRQSAPEQTHPHPNVWRASRARPCLRSRRPSPPCSRPGSRRENQRVGSRDIEPRRSLRRRRVGIRPARRRRRARARPAMGHRGNLGWFRRD